MDELLLGLMSDESAAFSLRKLYRKYGYSLFKMNKFEEYNLYTENKDFLISDSIISFTDLNGKLMAMKPDVTLSIIKSINNEKQNVSKLYYDEYVYRAPKGARSYKEIRQVGIECIGNIDTYSIYEVLLLAANSLYTISSESILDISHMGIITGLLKKASISKTAAIRIIKCISEKNAHEISEICKAEGCKDEIADILKKLTVMSGTPDTVIPKLKDLLYPDFSDELTALSDLCNALSNTQIKELIHIDFSVVNDMNYYNGIVFKGFVKHVPTRVLSGGQYDKLLHKMGKHGNAIGFAVYIDLLSDIRVNSNQFDSEAVLIYKDSDTLQDINKARLILMEQYKSVATFNNLPKDYRYKELFNVSDFEVQ